MPRPTKLAGSPRPLRALCQQDHLLSGHGRFLLGQAAAAALFDRIASTVREGWHTEMRRAGASARDCAAIEPAFLYDGLFYENVA